MLAALRIFRKCKAECEVDIWLGHIPGELNVIADRLSLGKISEAREVGESIWNCIKEIKIPAVMDNWIKQVVGAGREAARRRRQ